MNNMIDWTNINNISENEGEIKRIIISLKKYSEELNTIKMNADLEWKNCSQYFDSVTRNKIENIKERNNKNFKKKLEELENYANKLDYISNVYLDAEMEIQSSTRKFENIFEEFEKNLMNILQKK